MDVQPATRRLGPRSRFLIAVGPLLLLAGFCVFAATAGPDPRALVEEGRPLVRAILAYRAEWGRCPARLDDLAPRHHPQDERLPRWFYDTGWDHRADREYFSISAGGRHRSVSYRSDQGWLLHAGESSLPPTLLAGPEP